MTSDFSSWQDRKNEKCQQICQQTSSRMHNSRELLLNMEKNVQLKYRLYRRHNGIFYWQENRSTKQGTLSTTDRREAGRLLNAMNESHREPTLNLNLARAYLAAHDPKMAQRTSQAVMDEMFIGAKTSARSASRAVSVNDRKKTPCFPPRPSGFRRFISKH
jgi:hypothetical protein